MYSFYVRMDGAEFGPYTLKDLMQLGILEDTEIMEESIGEWNPASDYPFAEMYLQEYGIPLPEGAVNPIGNRGTRVSCNSENTVINDHFQEESSPLDNIHVLPKMSGWNWGAFLLGWIWGVGHKIYWPLIAIPIGLIPEVGLYLCLGINVILGIYGNEWAWNNSNLTPLQFKEREKNWSIAGFAVLIIGVFVSLAFLGM